MQDLTPENLGAVKDAPQVEIVEVEELGFRIRLGQMSSYDNDAYQASINDGEKANLSNFRARLVARCLIKPDGSKLFTDYDHGAKIVGSWPTSAVRRLFAICRKINAMTTGEIEEIEKNSNADQSADSQ